MRENTTTAPCKQPNRGNLTFHSPPYGGGAGGGADTIYACFHPFYNTTLSAAFFNVAKKCTASSC